MMTTQIPKKVREDVEFYVASWVKPQRLRYDGAQEFYGYTEDKIILYFKKG